MKKSRSRTSGVRACLAALLVAAMLAWPASPAMAGPDKCAVKAGAPAPTEIPWAQTRLRFDRVHELATGTGQTIAVIDSGLTVERHPQSSKIRVTKPTNVMGGAYAASDTRDCEDYGHGTRVSALIAAPAQDGVAFRGLAPDATIMPIKYRDSDTQQVGGDSAAVARAITAAIEAKVDVINLSLVTPDVPALKAAVKAAGRADIVVVASSGNQDGNGIPSRHPAAYAAEEGFEHVLAVGAVDAMDQATSFSVTGPYVGISAPGSGIVAPTQLQGYYTDDGTSFAAPFVSATAALIRQTHPQMSAPEVVRRIEATADRPGKDVPDAAYGWGIVNPYRAVAAERVDTPTDQTGQSVQPVTAPDLPQPRDHTLRDRGYAIAAGLLGAAIIAAVLTMAWRHAAGRRRGQPA